jgi:hypothetical protein
VEIVHFPLLARTWVNVTASEADNLQATDYELAQSASSGDISAFELLYERHNRRVYSLCLQIVHGTENPLQMPVVDRIALDKAISQLPPGYRTVFILHDVEGHEHEEIARMLGCSVGTSKSQLHKARMKLRTLLRQQIQPE